MTDCVKIGDAIKAREGERPFVSIEFFPPRTEVIISLYVKNIELGCS